MKNGRRPLRRGEGGANYALLYFTGKFVNLCKFQTSWWGESQSERKAFYRGVYVKSYVEFSMRVLLIVRAECTPVMLFKSRSYVELNKKTGCLKFCQKSECIFFYCERLTRLADHLRKEKIFSKVFDLRGPQC